MTRYLDVQATGSLIQKIGLETVLQEMAGYIVGDYRRWNEFEKMPRVVHHSPVGVNELMHVSDKQFFTFKYVNGHPVNPAKGLMTVVAFGMLADIETGYPQLLSELTLTTALRTAATSAAFAKYAARKNSKKMAVIGCGGQSEFQIIAFKTLLGIKEFSIYDIDPEAMKKLQHNMSAFADITVTAASSIRDAVRGADIVTTATADKTKATILTPDMIEPGMHLNAIGGDCPGKTELHPDILPMGRVFVEYEPQTRIEGDIQHMPPDFPVTEIWEVFAGKQMARNSDDQITIFDGVGFALEDFSALRYLYDVSARLGAGVEIHLVPQLPDPKNLYSLLQTVTVSPPLIRAKQTVERSKGE